MLKVLFSCLNIGFGHATRSLAIAEQLKQKGVDVTFCIGKPYDSFLRKQGYKVITISPEMHLPQKAGDGFFESIKFISNNTMKVIKSSIHLKNALNRVKPDIVVTDSEPTVLIVNKFKNENIPNVMILHQPKLFINFLSRGINKIWISYLNKYCDKILIPDVVGIKIPNKLKNKTKKIGPISKKADCVKKFQKKTVLFIPSFATADKEEMVRKIQEFAQNHPKWNFVVLGQDKYEKSGNINLMKKENIKNPCDFIHASSIVVLSGYSSLMESVFYNKPVVLLPTQIEQKKISELGEKSGILLTGSYDDFSALEQLMQDKKLQKKIKEKQKKIITDGTKQAANEILSVL